MIKQPSRDIARNRRHKSIRNRVSGTASKPRLAVFRSNKYIYVQAIDDVTGATLAAASSKEKGLQDADGKTSTVAAAAIVGKAIGERLSAKNIQLVVFDRGGFLYHGQVKALADGAREAGIQF